MRKYLLSACLLLAMAGALMAEVKVEGEVKIPRDSYFDLKLTGDTKGAAVVWDFSDEEKLKITSLGNRVIANGPPGTYRLRVRVFRADKDGGLTFEEVRATLTIGTAPIPPDPKPPDPKPPDPPTPSVAPIPVPGLHVLIVEESGERDKLTAGQRSILTGKSVRDHLRAKCATDPVAGDHKAYRIWDKDVIANGDAKIWQDALARAKGTAGFRTPWLIVSNHPKGGYEGPLPATVVDMMALLKKWGG